MPRWEKHRDAVIPDSNDPMGSERASRVLQEAVRRSMETLRLYEPSPVQEAFHQSKAAERIVRGANRSGKTTTAAFECARAVTGQDPYGKYPKENGRAIFVAQDQRELAQVIYAKLFRAGAIKMIPDEVTGAWRTYKQWLPGDKAREHLAKPAPPMIPERMIKTRSFHDKAAGVPNLITLHNGWEIIFCTANSSPLKGVDVDLVWFTEEIQSAEGASWYEEMAARLVDRHGRFVWDCTPQNATQDLYDLAQRAQDPTDTEVEEYKTSWADNRYVGDAEREMLRKKYEKNPEAYRTRIEGEYAILAYKVYPYFSMSRELHGVAPELVTGVNARGETVSEAQVTEFRDRWNHYLIVDPGSIICGVLHGAVPPPESPFKDQRFIASELYIEHCTATKFARSVAEIVLGTPFVEFIIDPSAAKTEVGSGKRIIDQYADALHDLGVTSSKSGSGFTLGANAILPGLEKVTGWMVVNHDIGKPTIKVVEGACDKLVWEMERYHRRKKDGTLIDLPVDKHNHLLDCLRYFAMRDPQWIEPARLPRPKGYVWTFLEKMRASDQRQGPDHLTFGPRERVA
jgi:hypothetical protein